MIQTIPSADVNQITSGQVITDLVSATKEAVENAIDAHASQIEVSFENYGVDSITIADNGSGIPEDDFSKICKRHCTSKLASYEDLAHTTTLGFRGEAMSSLCALAHLRITTCTQEAYPRAARLEFDHMGELVQTTRMLAKKGTTVSISNLFDNLPVRRKDFQKNHKREFNRAIAVLTNYAIIMPHIRFTIFNISGKNNKKNLVVSTQGGDKNTILKNMISIFGTNGNAGLVPLDIETEDIQMKFKLNKGELPVTRLMTIKFKGYISNTSFGLGRLSTDRQFFYINDRPVNMKRFAKCINEVYRSFNNVQYPVVIFNLVVDNAFLDINVSPDKRTILIHNEETVIDVLRGKLTEFFDEGGNVIPKNTKERVRLRVEPKQQSLDLLVLTPFNLEEVTQTAQETVCSSDTELLQTEIEGMKGNSLKDTGIDMKSLVKRDRRYEITTYEPINDESMPSQVFVDASDEEIRQENAHWHSTNDDNFEVDSSSPIVKAAQSTVVDECVTEHLRDEDEVSEIEVDLREATPDTYNPKIRSSKVIKSTLQQNGDDQGDLHSQMTHFATSDDRHSDDSCCSSSPSHHTSPLVATPAPKVKSLESVHDIVKVVDIDRDDLKRGALMAFGKEDHRDTKSTRTLSHKKVEDITKTTEAENKLTLTVLKSDFRQMNVIGQFNLGFILVTRPPTHTHKFSDLFIIDQHASDEKYNFETLQATTVFQSQPLVIPYTLEMSAIDELVVLDNVDIFKKNGFNIRYNEDERPGHRMTLISLPLLKRTVFDLTDFYELVHLVKERQVSDGVASEVRCSKIRTMFALRACRSSIMIGQYLQRATMQRVVHNLGGLDKPWNCPHGRPTMRHLMELKDWTQFDKDYNI